MIKDFEEIYANALEYRLQDHTGFKSGVSNLDKIFRLEKGDFVVLCGNPNDGKSTFIQWYLYKMSLNNKWKIAYLNFEGKEEETFLQILSYYRNVELMKQHVNFCEIENLTNIDQVITDIEKAKELKDIDCYVIDPYSNLLLGNVDTYTIAQDLAKLQNIGRKLKVTIILLCHPPKNAEEINIYNIKGSSSFAERADVGLSIKRDYENNTTVVKVDKLRANGLRGMVKGEATLQYRNFSFTEVENNDLPFGKFVDNRKEETIDLNTILNEAHKSQEIPLQSVKNLLVDNYTTFNEKTPYNQNKLVKSINVTDNDSVRQIIEKIRQLDNKDQIRALKAKLPCVMVSAKCGIDKQDIKEYTNIICIDIDKQDNPNLTLSQMKDIVNKSPYVFFSAQSVSGKGLLALIYLDGTIEDFKPHFYALERYFKDKGIIIDKQCKNVNRLRFVTMDNNPYVNGHALIYKGKIKETTQSVTRSILPQAKIDLNKDKEKILNILDKCKKESLIINPTHSETCTLSMVIAKYFGEDGFNIFMEFMKIKHKGWIDENKYYGTYLRDTESDINLTVGTLIYLYNKIKNNL